MKDRRGAQACDKMAISHPWADT